MKKEWKPINGYEHEYLISNFGDVYSLRNEKLLLPSRNEKGYLRVCLQTDGKKSWKRIHRLVAEAFIDNPESKSTVNHINGIRDDNRVENLEWATMKEQNSDERRSKLMSSSLRQCTAVEEKKKAVLMSDLDGNFICRFESMNDAARALGNRKTLGRIYMCCNGIRHSCQGYVFSYA